MAKRPINLNKARKRRDRAARERSAETNRRWHGVSAEERERLLAERERAERAHAGKRLEDAPEPDEDDDPQV